MVHVKKSDRSKPWAKKIDYKRNQSFTRKIKSVFLIYCEGKNTEPTYFKSFPVNSETSVEAIGFGRSRTALIQHIIDLASAKELLFGQDNYDPDRQIWCVFDKDKKGTDGEDEDFNNAVNLALNKKLLVAYSNDSFELWFVLHDKYIDTKQNRKHYYKYLSERFNINYEKDGKSMSFVSNLYNVLLPKQKDAIRNAEKLHITHKDANDYSNYCPCTTVYKLVRQLNKCLKS